MHMRNATASSTAPAFLWTRVPSEHEHGFPTFFIQLLEQQEGFLFQSQTAFLVAVDDVQCVLPPVVGDVVAFEGLQNTCSMSMMHDIELKGDVLTKRKRDGIYSPLATQCGTDPRFPLGNS